jgi:pyruvate dehydrogenase E2 component (dihydrolipoamide acetyltransferase)
VAEVQLPQLGESVTEGIITQWLVAVGDTVDVDQPIAEISTDKVDTEIPSPIAGTVKELRFNVDDTVEVGQVLAVIGENDTTTDDTAANDNADNTDTTTDDTAANDDTDSDDTPAQDTDTSGKTTEAAKPAASGDSAPATSEAGRSVVTSPLVRKLLREAGIDPADVTGTGTGGRVTRDDAERAVAEGPQRAAGGKSASPAPPVPSRGLIDRERPPASPQQIDFAGERDVTQELPRIRKVIAKSMMDSLQHTAQLTAAVEADVSNIMHVREALKDDFKQREGVSLSPLAMIARGACMTLPRHPALNASIDQQAGTATYHRYVNLGMAVDTERGLLVPNIKDAQDLTVTGLARGIADLASRARSKQLGPNDISGGTFTITNTGSMGTLFDTPILNPPEVAILATPAIEKRPVVISDGISDAIAIRWMTYLCLTYDHRLVDGADAARFLQDLKFVLETHDFATELSG